MRRCLCLSVFCLALPSGGVRGEDPQPSAPGIDTAALEKRVADLERQLGTIQKELQEIRRELQAQARPGVTVLTPEQAVKAFRQNPQGWVLVEFGVESAGWPDGPIPFGEDPMPPIMADWDGRLSNGGKFSLLLKPRAIRGLKDVGVDLPSAMPPELVDLQRLSVLCKHLKGKGVRVTGFVQASRPNETTTDYYVVVDDPADFRINE
jgi:hypothetical protein